MTHVGRCTLISYSCQSGLLFFFWPFFLSARGRPIPRSRAIQPIPPRSSREGGSCPFRVPSWLDLERLLAQDSLQPSLMNLVGIHGSRLEYVRAWKVKESHFPLGEYPNFSMDDLNEEELVIPCRDVHRSGLVVCYRSFDVQLGFEPEKGSFLSTTDQPLSLGTHHFDSRASVRTLQGLFQEKLVIDFDLLIGRVTKKLPHFPNLFSKIRDCVFL